MTPLSLAIICGAVALALALGLAAFLEFLATSPKRMNRRF